MLAQGKDNKPVRAKQIRRNAVWVLLPLDYQIRRLYRALPVFPY